MKTNPKSDLPAKVHQSVIADLAGLTERRLSQLASKRVIPGAASGMYPLAKTIKALIAYYQTANREKSEGLLKKQEANLDKKNRLLDLEIEEKERTLVPVFAVERVWGEIIDVFRNQVTSLPIPEAQKLELISNLQKPTIDEYFSAANIVATQDGGDDDSASQNPEAA